MPVARRPGAAATAATAELTAQHTRATPTARAGTGKRRCLLPVLLRTAGMMGAIDFGRAGLCAKPARSGGAGGRYQGRRRGRGHVACAVWSQLSACTQPCSASASSGEKNGGSRHKLRCNNTETIGTNGLPKQVSARQYRACKTGCCACCGGGKVGAAGGTQRMASNGDPDAHLQGTFQCDPPRAVWQPPAGNEPEIAGRQLLRICRRSI